MSRYRHYTPPELLLIGYDPARDLAPDHLARLVEQVVEETVGPKPRDGGPGQPPYDPRLCVKVLIYGYATGVRSSRQLERACRESLPFLFLTRGDAPNYHTLCTSRTQEGDYLEAVWEGLFAVAAAVGLERLGRIAVDSTKFRADASPEAVLTRDEYAPVRAELERILAEAAAADAQEATPGMPTIQLGKTVPREQMRDILRRVRQQQARTRRELSGRGEPPAGPETPSGRVGLEMEATATLPLTDPEQAASPEPASQEEPDPGKRAAQAQAMTPKMLQRVKAGLAAIQAAIEEGRKHLCLTDPDARMMFGERERGIRECHSFEVAVDHGLLVVGQTTQEGHDNTRLQPLVTAAAQHTPGGVMAVDADSGYYAGDALGKLLAAGIDTCVPDPHTAADLHRGEPAGTTRARLYGSVPFTYDATADQYQCPEGNTLVQSGKRQVKGQLLTFYRAQEPCVGCPRRAECLLYPKARHRTLGVGEYAAELAQARARFAEPEHQARYHHRGEAVETVFGFLRGALGFRRWLLRGKGKVACEGRLFKLAYQLRKVHVAWTSP
jgi:transposase